MTDHIQRLPGKPGDTHTRCERYTGPGTTHKTPPNIPATILQAFITDLMIEPPVRFVGGILGYTTDPDVRMDDFDEYLVPGETAPDFTLRTIH